MTSASKNEASRSDGTPKASKKSKSGKVSSDELKATDNELSQRFAILEAMILSFTVKPKTLKWCDMYSLKKDYSSKKCTIGPTSWLG